VSSDHSVTPNHSGSGNNSGPTFLFERNFLVEMKIKRKKIFSGNKNSMKEIF